MKIKNFSYKSLACLFGITAALNVIALIAGIVLHELDGWAITFLGLMVFDMTASVIDCDR